MSHPGTLNSNKVLGIFNKKQPSFLHLIASSNNVVVSTHMNLFVMFMITA